MEATDASRLVCVVVVSYQEYSLTHSRAAAVPDVGLWCLRRCCQVVLSGCCQALTHTSHTYDTIKRALTIKGALTPMTPAATQLPYGVITPAAAAGTATG